METESGKMSQECEEVWRAKEDGREVQRHMNNRGQSPEVMPGGL